MQNYSEEQFINVGSGSEIAIKNLAETVHRIVGFEGRVVWDTVQTGRHAAQIDGQLPAFCAGLETAGGFGSRHPPGL